MLRILIPSRNPRTEYTLDLVFQKILGVGYQSVLFSEYEPSGDFPTINYTQLIIPEAFSIPNAGLLKQTGIEEPDLRIRHKDIPWLFHFPVSGSSYQLDFDIFSAVFYLVTEYEKYLTIHKDTYGRYDQLAYPSEQLDLHEFPLVHIYCNQLWQKLKGYFPRLEGSRQTPSFDYHLTYDIDFPWKYSHKGMMVSLGGLVKDIQGKVWDRARERINTWTSGKDPNDTYDLIFELSPPEKTTFFFLIDRDSSYDSRFTYQHPRYRELINLIAARGYHIGVHPSFNSFQDEKRLHQEVKYLADIISGNVTASRQHFLRYRLPTTFRYLVNAGITDDFTLCRIHRNGFPCGMARPFPWYDLEKEETTSLTLHPTLAMDRTLVQYMGLDPDQAKERLQKILRTAQGVDGIFTLLLHNDVFSDSEEWKGWREPIKDFVQELIG